MKRTFISALLLLAGLAWPFGALAANCLLQKVAEMPVTMQGMRPMITAQINGQDVHLFIDTGSFFSTLSPATVARLGLRAGPLPPYLQVRGLTGEADMRLTTAKTFTLVGVPFRNADFLVDEHALSGDGLIGENIFNQFDVEYDFADGVVRLFLPKGCGDHPLAYWSKDGTFAELSIEPTTKLKSAIIGWASVNGAKIRVLFDTGTPRSAMTLRAARRAGVKTDGPDVVSAGMTRGVGRRVIPSWLAPFSSFAVGGEQVKSTRLRVADFDLDEADMLIGTDFFLSHRILISHSQNKLYFTYNGGPVFNLEQGGGSPPTPPAGATQIAAGQAADADGLARRAAAELSRHEYEPAIADDTQAIALAPSDAHLFYDRGVAHLLNHQPAVAMADFDQALKLKPDAAPALVARGELKLAARDEAGARADFDAALKVEPGLAARVGELYARAGLLQPALAELDAWIAGHPKNEDLAGPLGTRCRIRALQGQDLDQAMADCQQSLHYVPDRPDVLTSRGLVLLRQNRMDRALGDFSAALRLQPQTPWALYGRGVVRLRKGDTANGNADLAAAAAIAPRLADQAKKTGITP